MKLVDRIRTTFANPSDDTRTAMLVVFFLVIVGSLVWGWAQVQTWSDSVNHVRR